MIKKDTKNFRLLRRKIDRQIWIINEQKHQDVNILLEMHCHIIHITF